MDDKLIPISSRRIFLEESKKHGPYVIINNIAELPCLVTDTEFTTYSGKTVLFKDCDNIYWEDNFPCMAYSEEFKRELEQFEEKLSHLKVYNPYK